MQTERSLAAGIMDDQQVDGGVERVNEPPERLVVREWAPPALIAFGAIVVLGGNQGGYFPTAWGPITVVLLAVVALCLVFGSTTDMSRLDGAFVLAVGALVGWVAVSMIWSAAPAETAREFQRGLVLLAGASAMLLLARRGSQGRIASSIAAGTVILAGYALLTRLLPGRLEVFSSSDGYRLSSPIGYWNGLGILAAIGFVLVVGIAIESPDLWERIVAAAALCVLAPTLYFTFSRGGWAALVAGLVAMLIVSPRRLRTLAGLVFVLIPPLVAVLVASTLEGLTTEDVSITTASHDGRRYLPVLALCVVGAGLASVAWTACERRIRVGARARVAVGGAVVATVVLVLLAGVMAKGGPASVAEAFKRTFDTPHPQEQSHSLNSRLSSLSGSGRVDLWRVAVSEWRSAPLSGTGAGSFGRYWEKDPRWTHIVTDAHNLYLETLAELGPIGLALLLAMLAIPVGALVAARQQPVMAAAFGSYAAYLVHAATDWDWELSAVTLTALLIGCLGIIAVRTDRPRRLRRSARIGGGVTVASIAAVAAIGYVGEDAINRAQDDLQLENPRAAISEARTGERWVPWSPYPPTIRGEALLRLNETAAAQDAFRLAIERDPRYWRSWLGLAVASEGRARRDALHEAKALYPQSVEIEETEKLLSQ
jgi:hypothetical protein